MSKPVSISEAFLLTVNIPLPVIVGVSAMLFVFACRPSSVTEKSKEIEFDSTHGKPSGSNIILANDLETEASEVAENHVSPYRYEEEAGKRQTVEYSRRGRLWIRRASWYLPACPRSKKQFSLDSAPLQQIISNLKKFDVDPNTGFLPCQDPIHRLSCARYHIWEDLADDLPKLLGARLGQARGPLRELPVLSTDMLTTNAELRRAHLLLCFLAHAFVWGGEKPMDILPQGIAIPLWEVSQRLGLPAVLSHTDVVLYNWRRLDTNGEICMENLSTLNNFFDGRDESWFYLLTVEIEAKGAAAIVPMLLIIDAIQRYKDEVAVNPAKKQIRKETLRSYTIEDKHQFSNDLPKDDKEEFIYLDEPLLGELFIHRVLLYISAQLKHVSQAIANINVSLSNMREGCLPYIFYHRVRPFLSGWKNNPTMPNGLLYEGVSSTPFFFYGGSAAQSALLPFLDITFGISHEGSKSHEFLMAMRDYMLKSHREYLIHLKEIANLREFVLEQVDSITELERKGTGNLSKEEATLYGDISSLQQQYDECVANLTAFRTSHISIVAEYVMAQQKLDPNQKVNALKGGIEQSAGGKGTGGTDLMTFLKPIRDDCQESFTNSTALHRP